MVPLLVQSPSVGRTARPGLRGRHRRGGRGAAERRRLVRQDALAVRLAELHRIRAVLEDATVLVSIGWIQHAWFAVLDGQGRQRLLTAPDVLQATDHAVVGVCLVGGLVHAGGGPLAVRSQLVQRTLDVTWHALREDEREPVRWCPSPEVRAAHLRDLTRWNDHPQRTPAQVSALLEAAVRTVGHEISSRQGDQQVGLAPATR